MCLYDVLDIPDKLKPFVNDYKINLVDVPRLTTEQVENYKGDFQIIADYFVLCIYYNIYNNNSKIYCGQISYPLGICYELVLSISWENVKIIR